MNTRMNQNTDITPAEVRRRLVDAVVSVPRGSRVRAAAAIQGARAARTARAAHIVCTRAVRHWE
ncbi:MULTISPECIES: hypothetical protein [unclassified Streptomyces]|uniref:hypothetical protein n=1 Tax=unclassified Streptomyces TaxID=2593676 RepID=UPI001F339078|nr:MULTISPECIES: hypothetical protein [unclassified Streptomyces]